MNIKPVILRGIAFILISIAASSCGDKNVGEGRKLFGYYCMSCHGEKGMGDGFNSANLDPTPRDLSDGTEVYMAKQKNEDLFKVISLGGGAIEKSPRMPPFGKTLSEKEIWQTIAFVRSLHSYDAEEIVFEKDVDGEKKDEFDTKRPKTPAKKIEAKVFKKKNRRAQMMGKKIYKKNGCSGCHRIGESGGVVGPDLTHIGKRLNGNWIYKFLLSPQVVIKNVKMPNYGLKEKTALRIAHYLVSLK